MAYSAGAIAAATMHTSSYRVKFKRAAFIELVSFAKPERIYQTGRMHFFAFDGFVMYSLECNDQDFPGHRIFHAIEFSNYQWSE